MPLFKRSADLPTAWDPKPWWRLLSVGGFGVMLLGVSSTLFFVLGAATGEALFIFPTKMVAIPFEASVHTSPILYFVLMGANLITSCAIWLWFLSWLKERRRGAWGSPPSFM